MPKRIQRKRAKGWRMPENAVYVGRPTKWGNPYRVVETGGIFAVFRETTLGPVPMATAHTERKMAQQEAVNLYRRHVAFRLGSILHELRGKDLACWCRLGEPCHADVLIELANAPTGT